MAQLAVVNCGQLVTVAGPARARVREELRELSIIEHGAMLIRNGVIEKVGRNLQLPSDCEVLDANHRVVLPGFVDAHTHPVFAGTRIDEFELRTAGASYEEIAAAGGGIRSTVRKTRAASEDELFRNRRTYGTLGSCGAERPRLRRNPDTGSRSKTSSRCCGSFGD